MSAQWQYNGFYIVIYVWIKKRVLQELLLFNEFRNIKHLVFSLYLCIGAAWSANDNIMVSTLWLTCVLRKHFLQELLLCDEFRNIKHLVYSLYLSIGTACVCPMTIWWFPYCPWHVDLDMSYARATHIQWIQKYQASCILTLPKYRCRSYTYFLCLIVKLY